MDIQGWKNHQAFQYSDDDPPFITVLYVQRCDEDYGRAMQFWTQDYPENRVRAYAIATELENARETVLLIESDQDADGWPDILDCTSDEVGP